MITLTDPTMTGTKDPKRMIRKREDRIECLMEEIEVRRDQIMILRSEIRGLKHDNS